MYGQVGVVSALRRSSCDSIMVKAELESGASDDPIFNVIVPRIAQGL